jgi:hypothetical protein
VKLGQWSLLALILSSLSAEGRCSRVGGLGLLPLVVRRQGERRGVKSRGGKRVSGT